MKEKIVNFLQVNKRLLIFTLLLGIGSAIVFMRSFNKRSALDSVPNTCAITIWEEALDTNMLQLFPDLVVDYQAFNAFLSQLGIENKHERIAWQINSIGRDKVALSAAFQVKEKWSTSVLKKISTNESTYKGVSLYTKENSLAFAYYKGLCLLGRLPIQVEASIASLKEEKHIPPKQLEKGGMILDLENIFLSQGFSLEENDKRFLRYLSKRTNQIYLQKKGLKDSLIFEGQLLGLQEEFTASEVSSFLNFLPSDINWGYQIPYIKEDWLPAIRAYLGSNHAVFSLSGIDKAVAILALKEVEAVEQWLDILAKERGELQPYTYQLFQLRQLLDDDIFKPISEDFKNPYWVLLDGCLLISESRLALEQTLSSYIANQTLSQEVDFLQDWQRYADVLSPNLWYYRKREENGQQEKWLLQIATNGAVKGQWKTTKGYDRSRKASLLWAAPLLSDASSAAQVVKGEQGYVYLIQDQRHHLYLIDEEGNELWRKSLKGNILGEIAVIDYYRNEGPCFAFTLSDGIYLLNYNGQEVHPFPVQVPSPIVTPILAADLEGEGYYTFFTATTDGHIYGFMRDGTPLPGWSPHGLLDSTLRHPLIHIQDKAKDYIIALSDAGTLYAFARNGTPRFDSIQTNQKFNSPIYYQAVVPNGRIAIGDEKGLIHIINLSGDYFRLKASNALKPSSRFLFTNMYGDDRNDYLVYSKGNYNLSYYKGNDFVSLFNKKMNYPIDTAFNLRHNPYNWVGTLSKDQQIINLIIADGSIHPAFPLAGTTPFCWHTDELGGMNIIVGNGQRLYAYKIFN